MTVPDWSPAQAAAIERVRSWLEDPFGGGTQERGVFRLFGHAGSGKTTLARHLAASVSGTVRYAAYTGKAALVMHRKGCLGATTIHRLIYLPKNKCRLQLRELQERLRAETDEDRRRETQALIDLEVENLHRPSFTLNVLSPLREAALLVVDEVSMIGQQAGRDLLSFEVPILALGDPAQLPPVQDRGYFTDPRQEPDVLLAEVHRQAAGSPVLEMATRVRRGESLPRGDYGQGSRVIAPREMSITEAYETHDQIICGKNATRRAICNRVRREVLGQAGPLPAAGDRLVCLRNDGEVGLLNGGQWRCLGVEILDAERALLTVESADEDVDPARLTVEAHLAYFRGERPRPYEVRDAQCFDFAYAITCHKSQGSQWRSVCVVDEADVFGAEARRHRYTAITRASERVTVVR